MDALKTRFENYQRTWSNLVIQIQQGNDATFTDFYSETYQYAYNIVIGIVKNREDTEDILQHTYIRLLNSVKKIENPQAITGWVSTVFKNAALGHLRKQKSRPDIESYETEEFYNFIEDEDARPEDIILDREDLLVINELINNLPEKQSSVLRLVLIDDLSYNSVADILDISVGTVKSRLFNARKNLIQSMDDYQERTGTRLYSIAALPFIFKMLDQLRIEQAIPYGAGPAIWQGILDNFHAANSNHFIDPQANHGNFGLNKPNQGTDFFNPQLASQAASASKPILGSFLVKAVLGVSVVAVSVFGVSKIIESNSGKSEPNDQIVSEEVDSSVNEIIDAFSEESLAEVIEEKEDSEEERIAKINNRVLSEYKKILEENEEQIKSAEYNRSFDLNGRSVILDDINKDGIYEMIYISAYMPKEVIAAPVSIAVQLVYYDKQIDGLNTYPLTSGTIEVGTLDISVYNNIKSNRLVTLLMNGFGGGYVAEITFHPVLEDGQHANAEQLESYKQSYIIGYDGASDKITYTHKKDGNEEVIDKSQYIAIANELVDSEKTVGLMQLPYRMNDDNIQYRPPQSQENAENKLMLSYDQALDLIAQLIGGDTEKQDTEMVNKDYEEEIIALAQQSISEPSSYAEYAIYDIDGDGLDEYIIHVYDDSPSLGAPQTSTWEIFKQTPEGLRSYYVDFLGREELTINNKNILSMSPSGQWTHRIPGLPENLSLVRKGNLKENNISIAMSTNYDEISSLLELHILEYERVPKISPISSISNWQEFAENYLEEGKIFVFPNKNLDRYQSESNGDPARKLVYKAEITVYDSIQDYINAKKSE